MAAGVCAGVDIGIASSADLELIRVRHPASIPTRADNSTNRPGCLRFRLARRGQLWYTARDGPRSQ